MPQPSGGCAGEVAVNTAAPFGTGIAALGGITATDIDLGLRQECAERGEGETLEEGMQRPDDSQFRRRLLEARAALLRTVALTDEELAALDRPQPSDPPEQAASASAASLQARLGGREKRELDDIADALRRLARGVYGACESCGKPIPLERLLALPAVCFCLGCQTSMEASP